MSGNGAIAHQTAEASPSAAPRPKVSVAMVTYNHECFIEQAVESVLMQRTDFAVELVIGEDCSTDRTREIGLSLQSKHPDRMRLLLPQANLGMMRNWVHTLRACTGQYIAVLEGDDYWTHPLKLQRQVDRLEAEPGMSACFTRARVVAEGRGDTRYIPSDDPSRSSFRTEDLLEKNHIATCSLLFRNVMRGLDLDPFSRLSMIDWPLNLMLSLRGPVAYLNEVMAAYRQHGGGVWSGLASSKQYHEIARMYSALRPLMPMQYRRRTLEREIKCQQLASLELLRDGDRRAARSHAFLSLRLIPPGAMVRLRWYVKRAGALLLGSYGWPFDRVERALVQ